MNPTLPTVGYQRTDEGRSNLTPAAFVANPCPKIKAHREILWFCLNDPKEVRANLRFLGDEHDKCSSPTLKVFGKKTVTVAKGETATVLLSDRHFEWRCGDSNEESVAPEGTDVIFVTRAGAGRDITWACYSGSEWLATTILTKVAGI
jgi:hypothetical protein